MIFENWKPVFLYPDYFFFFEFLPANVTAPAEIEFSVGKAIGPIHGLYTNGDCRRKRATSSGPTPPAYPGWMIDWAIPRPLIIKY
jgi:hypothetical protein